MYRKCFFKNKGVLSRRFVASGLAAVFSAGMFGSYSVEAARKSEFKHSQSVSVHSQSVSDHSQSVSDHSQLDPSALSVLNNEVLYGSRAEARELAALYIGGEKPEDVIEKVVTSNPGLCKKLVKVFANKEEEFLNFVADVLRHYVKAKAKGNFEKWNNFSSFVVDAKSVGLSLEVLKNIFEEVEEKLLLIALECVKETHKKSDNVSGQHKENIKSNILNKKNKLFSKWKLIVPIGVGVVVFIVIAIILSVKGKSNTDNNNKDDEKVNPPIDPENPLTDPESDDENLEQKKQEQGSQEQKSSIGLEILKGAGTAAAGGTLAGGGTYLVNEVLKSGKPSEVKNLRNVDDKYMYLDSDGNEVIKTEGKEKAHNNYVADNENANNSGTKQLLEDKDAEEKEEGQEEILESSVLSDDTEATSDEDKNKD